MTALLPSERLGVPPTCPEVDALLAMARDGTRHLMFWEWNAQAGGVVGTYQALDSEGDLVGYVNCTPEFAARFNKHFS